MRPKAGGDCGVSADEYSCAAHGAQINFGDLTPYLSYVCVGLCWPEGEVVALDVSNEWHAAQTGHHVKAALLVYLRHFLACTDKKENQIFLIYKEIQNGTVAKSYMTNGLLIYEYVEIFAHFLIY